jgi:RNA polymerase sigma-70 factor (ECF subfamily)
MSKSEEFASALVMQLPSLRRYAVALVGNAALADDLVQDSIERALRQAAQLRELHTIRAWLRRILHNLYIDEIRKNRRRGTYHDITDFSDHPELAVQALDGLGNRDIVRAMNA